MSRMTIQIPTYPLSPPESPSRTFGSPDWFAPSKKQQPYPTGTIALNTPPLTPPPLSPISSETSSDEGDASPPRRPRLLHQTHRRTSGPSYFPDSSSLPTLPKRPAQPFRARFPSAPVTGIITPMWDIEEEEPPADPFKMLLPFCQPTLRLPTYAFNEKHFVLAHVPTGRLPFRARMPRIPRWQRPILMAVLCVMLFGSLCIVSWIQQSALAAQRASVIRQTVWLAETRDVSHNRVTRDDPTKLTLTSEQELAALMSFITGTAANSLPLLDPVETIDPELLLPFDSRSPHAQEELDELVQTQWENFPVMVLGKLRDPKMRNLRQVIKTYNIKPAPIFVDFDQRPDAEILESTLVRLLGKQNEPYMLLRGVNVPAATVQLLGQDEKVVETLGKTTVSVAKKLKKNKHQREEERQEMDRILGPAPIVDV